MFEEFSHFFQEKTGPDDTSGTSDFDIHNDKEPDDCYCESVDVSQVDIALLTSPKTIELCKKYRKPGASYFYYNAETRRKFGELPDNIVDNYFELIKILLTKKEIDYKTYKKYLDVLYKMHGIPSEACIKTTDTIRNTSYDDGKRDSILQIGVSKGKLPYSDNVRLFHTSSTANLTSLTPRFRSRKPGERIEALFPSPRVYFGYNAICFRDGGPTPSIESVNEDHFKKIIERTHLYEYVGPKNYITAIYKDPELQGSAAVYVETIHDLPVKEIKTFEEFKKGVVQEAYDAITGEEIPIDHAYTMDEMKERTYTDDDLDKIRPKEELDAFYTKLKSKLGQGETIQEAKLPAKKRKELPDSDFALVYTDNRTGKKVRKYPVHDKDHVESAARMFPRGVPLKYQGKVARKILRRAHEFGIDTSGWKNLNRFKESD